MGELLDAAETFFSHLASVDWAALGLALAMHGLRLATRTFAWRNIIAAAYPGTRVGWWSVFGSYVAGVGVNSVVPARGGDVLKLVLVKRRVEGSTYPTLTATLLVETVFDALVGAAVLGWALTLGVFPSVSAPSLPQVDWHWPLEHPKAAIVIAVVWAVVIVLLAVIGVRRARAFWQRVREGLTILRQPRRFLLGVVTWQACSWVLRVAGVYWFLEAFGIPATFRNAMLVVAVQSLSTLFPFTPGGVGTQQGFLVYVFRASGIDRTALLSFSVGMHIALTVANLLAGLLAIAIMLRTFRWRRAVAADQEEAYARDP